MLLLCVHSVGKYQFSQENNKKKTINPCHTNHSTDYRQLLFLSLDLPSTLLHVWGQTNHYFCIQNKHIKTITLAFFKFNCSLVWYKYNFTPPPPHPSQPLQHPGTLIQVRWNSNPLKNIPIFDNYLRLC